MNASLHTCPIPDCEWTLTDPGPETPNHPVKADDAQLLAEAHHGVIAAEIGAHLDTHGAPDWVPLVHQLRQELAKRPAPLLCAGCIRDRHDAQQAGDPLPSISLAQVIVGGNSACLAHVQFGTPQLPGRTPGGLIV